MKILVQKREGNKVVLEVEEDYSSLRNSFENALVEAGKEIKIPGFRPGKVPRNILEKSLNLEMIEHQAAQDLIASLYPKLIEETKIDPVDYPNVDIVSREKDKPFVFKLTVDVYPGVKLGKYKGLKLEKKSSSVEEEELLKALGRLQERLAVTSAEGKKELLPLDDEFAKKVSQFGTLAELKEEVRKALTDEKTAEAAADLKNKAVALASAETKVEIPAAMIDREIEVMIDELRGSLASSGLTVEDYLKGTKKEEKALREEMRKSAEIRVKGKIVMKAVAEAEKLTVAPEEIAAEIKGMAESSGQEIQAVEKNLGKGGRSFIEDYLLRRKALDLIIEKASVKEIKEEEANP